MGPPPFENRFLVCRILRAFSPAPGFLKPGFFSSIEGGGSGAFLCVLLT